MRTISTSPQAQPGAFGHLSSGRARASISGILWSFVNVSVSTALAVSVFLVTSRILAPSDFGAVAFALAMTTMVGALVPTAFSEALIQRADLDSDHLNAVFWLTITPAALGYGALTMLAPAISEWSGTPLLREILPVLALRLVFDAGLTVPAAVITRRMQFRYIALRTTVANGFGAAICLLMVTQGYALWALVISQVVASFISLLVTLLAAGWWPRLSFYPPALRDLRSFGLYAMGGRLLNEARLDQFILGLLLGSPILGLFYFARRICQMLNDLTTGVFSPVANVLLASLQGEKTKRQEAYLIASYASASLAFPTFAGLVAIAPTAVPFVFGPQWTGAIFATQCFAVIGMMAGLGVMQGALIRNLGRPDWWFFYQSVMQLSTIPIILGLFRFGLDAVMAAIVVRTLVLWPASVHMAQKMLDMPLTAYLNSLRGPVLATAVMVLTVILVPYLWSDLAAGSLLAAEVGTGAAVYALALMATSHGRLRQLLALLRANKRTTP